MFNFAAEISHKSFMNGKKNIIIMNKTTKVIALAMLLPLVSPINTSAFGLLYFKNPANAPATQAEITAASR